MYHTANPTGRSTLLFAKKTKLIITNNMNPEEFQITEVARLYSDMDSHKIANFLTGHSNRVPKIVKDSESGEDRDVKTTLLAKCLGSKNAASRMMDILRDKERLWHVISNGRTGLDKQHHTIMDVGLGFKPGHGTGFVLPIFSSHEFAQNYYEGMRESLPPGLTIGEESLYDLCDKVGRKTNLSINPLNDPFCEIISASVTEQIAIGLGVRDVQGEWLAGEGKAIKQYESQERKKSPFEMHEDILIEEMRSALTMAAMDMGDYSDYFQIAAVAYHRCPERARSDSGYWIIGQRASHNKRALRWAQDNLKEQPEDPQSHAFFALALLQIDPVAMRDKVLYHINAALRINPENFVAKLLLQSLHQ